MGKFVYGENVVFGKWIVNFKLFGKVVNDFGGVLKGLLILFF